jgi:hypothetical protein
VLRLALAGHLLHGSRMATLSQRFLAKFERIGDIDPIHHSISVMEEAIRITPQNDQGRPRMLMEFGICFGRHFDCTDDISDLEEAIGLSEEAMKLTDVGHKERATILNQLATWLFRRSEVTQSVVDHERAIAIADEALLLAPDDLRVLR